uniref:Transposase n=1 Tax=Heterorhabditis bacteriophora TaxID=37862 RepID=A0A1I7W9V6_HETBA
MKTKQLLTCIVAISRRFGQRSLATKFTELESNRIAVWLISKKKLSLTSDTNLDSQGRFSESLKAKEANFGY